MPPVRWSQSPLLTCGPRCGKVCCYQHPQAGKGSPPGHSDFSDFQSGLQSGVLSVFLLDTGNPVAVAECRRCPTWTFRWTPRLIQHTGCKTITKCGPRGWETDTGRCSGVQLAGRRRATYSRVRGPRCPRRGPSHPPSGNQPACLRRRRSGRSGGAGGQPRPAIAKRIDLRVLAFAAVCAAGWLRGLGRLSPLSSYSAAPNSVSCVAASMVLAGEGVWRSMAAMASRSVRVAPAGHALAMRAGSRRAAAMVSHSAR